jgi:glutamate synthase domain-containing protein 1
MCGIAGLFSKTAAERDLLGAHLAGMLTVLGARGPDSSGVALYRDPVGEGWAKLSLMGRDSEPDAEAIARDVAAGLGVEASARRAGDGVLLRVAADPEVAAAHIREALPGVRIIGTGRTVEICKRVGMPEGLIEAIGLEGLEADHALGHTRMATESRVTTEGSHPFSAGQDLCLIHNGSLSNHNRLRLRLRREGFVFETENDSEVAAGFLAWRMREGATLEQALEESLSALDGFFTFAVGTADGFAVLRDPVACKPAVMAETDDWVAVASEFRAIATLPGADDAHVWEPEPGRVYAWGRAPVAA